MKIQLITLFPEMFTEVINSSMLWKAQNQEVVEFNLIDLRQFGIGKRKNVDDTPYGGGDGMLLKPEPIFAAVEYAQSLDKDATVILPTPRGKIYKQSDAKKLASKERGLIIICPRYEGYDERIVNIVDEQYCIGNYILTGGEIPAMAILDSVVRLLPGVLGGETSKDIESFQDDDKTIEFPQYTRPETFRGESVPSALLNGNHKEIEKWREKHKSSQS
jgi:tRNA (guanine37-N1)-methyltransferase